MRDVISDSVDLLMTVSLAPFDTSLTLHNTFGHAVYRKTKCHRLKL